MSEARSEETKAIKKNEAQINSEIEARKKEAKELGESYLESVIKDLIDGIDKEKEKRKDALDKFKKDQEVKIKSIENEIDAEERLNDTLDEQKERTALRRIK